MFGVFVNMATIVAGAIIGITVKKGIPKKVSDATMEIMGLISLFIGIQGALKGEKTLVVLISLVLGTVVGTMIDINKYVEGFGEFLKKKFASNDSENAKFVDAFVTTSVLFGIGAMAILGSIEAGIKHEYSIFFLKSIMDFVSSVFYATTMGIGVAFSAITILVLQGSMTILASFIKPFADDVGLMNEVTCCGNILIMAIGLNVMGITKIKIANLLPSIILVPIIYYLYNLII